MSAVVARIGKPHGLRGEVTVQLHTDAPGERFVPEARFETDPDRGPLTIAGTRVHQGVWLLRFEEAGDRTAAEALRGTRLLLDEDATDDEDDEDAWYEDDLVGVQARDPEGAVLGEIIALDGKVTLDDNAAFRQPEHASLVDEAAEDPLEAKPKALNLNYVKLDGNVGIIGNGAGLVMSTLDVVAYAGEQHGGVKPANFLDIGGGANAQVMANGLDVILNDPQVKSVFVNVFGGITACDEVAKGIVGALEILGDEASKPLVVRLDGNNVDLGRAILREANHPLVTLAETMDGGADKAAELANA